MSITLKALKGAEGFRRQSRSLKEVAKELVIYVIIVIVLGECFYDSYIGVLALMPGFILFKRYMGERKQDNDKKEILKEFIVFLNSMSANILAGYSLENTIPIVKTELERNYKGELSTLAKECEYIEHQLSLSVSFNDAIYELGERTGVEEIIIFARLLSTAKESGGDIRGLIISTADQLKSSIRVNEDIDVLIASKKLEKNIMLCVPIGMIIFLRISNPGYIDVLYGNAFGICIMSACLGVMLAAFLVGERIINISLLD